MNIGIVSSIIFNPYAATLIYKLTEQSEKPICIIHAGKSKFTKLKKNLSQIGYRATLKKILQSYRQTGPVIETNKNYLEEYALSNHISDWNASLQAICKKEGIDYLKVDNVNSRRTVDYVKNRNLDILINAGGEIFRQDIISAPRIGILNAHMASLPAFRGMNVLEWSLFYGHQIGVSLHFINQGIDTGDVLLFREIQIEKGDSIDTLRAKSLVVNVELMVKGINSIKNKKEKRTIQELAKGKQYFVMHERLKQLVDRKLQDKLEKAE